MNAQSNIIQPLLRGVPPKETNRRLKLFLFGEPGVGKSYFSTHFNSPYYIDTERGVARAKYIDNIIRNQGIVFYTRKFDELYQEIVALSAVQHPYQTLVIDSITTIYNNLIEEELLKIENAGRRPKIAEEYQRANMQFKKLVGLLLDIDMNVIVTAHAKKEYGAEMQVIGTTFDAYKKIAFMFDVVIEAFIKKGRYMAISKKSRLLDLMPEQEFEFSFSEFSRLYKKELEYFQPKPTVAREEGAKNAE